MSHLSIGILAVASACALTACQRPDIIFPQFVRDQVLLEGITLGLSDLYQETVAGAAFGPLDLSADCAQGGSATVTGLLETDSLEVTFDLNDCRFVWIDEEDEGGSDLTLNGEITWIIYVAPGLTRYIEDYHAASLAITGEIAYAGKRVELDETCALSAFVEHNDLSSSLSANVCDRQVTSAYAHSACEW